MGKKLFATVVISVFLFNLGVRAQTTRGTILGSVRDQSGAPMAGVTVTATQTTTGLHRTDTTNDSGEYSIPELPVGPYTVTAEHPGFVKIERSGITLQVDDKLRVDLGLKVGQVNQTLVVQESAPVVQTDSATMGNVINTRAVTELPLNGRNFLQLNLLVPGVNQGVKGSQNQTQGGSISVNGAREQANNFLLDGMDNNDLAINQYSVALDPDAILEFKVQASTYTAEFGRSPGGQINVATRSGTNEFHGVLYEYLRNAKLDAKNFFDIPTAPIPPYKRNQFGGSFGGPIKKNKTFFFGNYEGTRIRQSITKVSTVPTEAMKSGDFSSLLGAAIGTDAEGRTIYAGEIFDPTTLHYVNGQPVRDPFVGNIIPPNMISPVGAAVANLFPNPNTGFASSYGQFTASPTARDDLDQFTVRVDHSFNEQTTLFARYSFTTENRLNTFDPFCSLTNIPGYGCNTLNGGQNAVVNVTHIFSPTKINEFRGGYNRTRGGIFSQNEGTDYSTQLGIAGTSRSPLDFGYPTIAVTGFDQLGDAGNLPQDRHDNTYEVSDSFSWVLGSHSIKFGADVRRFQLNLLFDSNARGTLTFDPFYTSEPVLQGGAVENLPNTGNALADLLLGVPYQSSISRSFGGPTANTVTGFRTFAVNPWIQDDWRVSSKLTLNLGLRWEYNSPVIDKYNHLATFDPTAPDMTRVSTPSQQNIYNVSKKEFAPRLGFAWTPFGPRTVIRGGYGVYWDEKILNILLIPALSPPFVVPEAFNAPTNGLPNINLASPYSGTGAGAGLPGATWVENPFRDGYVQQWSFNIQRQLSQSIGVTAAYVGSKGTHLDREYDINLPPPSAAFVQTNRPYPTFSDITVDSPSVSSSYNSMQLSMEKRFSKGLSFLAAYTLSKSIDDGSSWDATVIDPFNFHTERGLSTFDTRNRFVFSYTYDLPYGHGRAFGATIPGWVNELIGDWETDGIFTAQSGSPVDVTVGLTSLTGTETNTRPDLIANPNTGPHTPNMWFNTAAFSDNFLGRFGDAGRDVVIGPGTVDFDVSMLKNFLLGREMRYLQFRGEFFNVFNHPLFDNPVSTEASPAFGQILSAGAQDPRWSSRQIQLALRLVF